MNHYVLRFMRRFLVAVCAIGLSTTAFSQVCELEEDFGADIGLSDDSVSNQALGFSFPFQGSNYANAEVSSNGFLSLGGTNGSGCCDANVGSFLANNPRIAVAWYDLNPSAAGAVRFNSFPGRAVFTWDGVAEFSNTTPNTFQVQLFDDGTVIMSYVDLTPLEDVGHRHHALVGVTPGNGAGDPGDTDFTSTVAYSTGADGSTYEFFNRGPNGATGGTPDTFDLAGNTLFFEPNDSGGWEVSDCNTRDSLEKELTSGPDRDGSVWYDDFSDLSGLTLNGSAAQSGTALRLTPALTGQAGSAYTSSPLTLGPAGSFSTHFSFQITGSGGGGADGLTFIVHDDVAADNALGGGGGAMGYTGITPSLVVEYDSWNNGGAGGDPDANHVGTAFNGVLGSGVAVPLGAPPLDGGSVFYTWIDYDGIADQLEVRLSTVNVRPAAPTLSQGGIGLAGLLGGTSAYVGFTAATGAAFGNHDILSWHFASAIDLVVPINVEVPTAYDFTITYDGNTPVWVYDTVPAEWDVTHVEFDDTGLPLGCGEETDFVGPFGMVDIWRGGKAGKKCNSDTSFRWMPDVDNTLNVQTEARCHDNRNNSRCRPTSCGALYLNYGAIAFEKDPATGELVLDADGNPIVVGGPTNPICLAAVDDVDGDGTFTWDGTGDEDGDNLDDWVEACEGVTDPCLADTDGDGVNDDVDNCPLEGPADPALGEILDPNGCIRQSQCSDGVDNDADGPIDYPDDASCDSILDDSEDTPDVFASGTFAVRGTFAFDLDLGAENSNPGPATLLPPSDIWFARITATESEFTPVNGATQVLWGPAQPSSADCAGAALSGATISFFAMNPSAPSTWLCAMTDEGRLSAFRVFSGSADPADIWNSQNIVIEFVTWP